MGNVHGDSHVSEVKSVAQPYQANGDEVMRNKLVVILSRLLEHQKKDNELLRPVTSLEQVVRFDDAFVGSVREAFVHANGVEVPYRCARHDPQSERAVQTKV